MAYRVLQWPNSVYPGEVNRECPEGLAVVDALIGRLQTQGPSPDGYAVKTLGKKRAGLWQINLKVQKRQIRVLYAPYKDIIVLFRIHKKSSQQEQEQAYQLAAKRKLEYETALENT
jgi:hypothetical protein